MAVLVGGARVRRTRLARTAALRRPPRCRGVGAAHSRRHRRRCYRLTATTAERATTARKLENSPSVHAGAVSYGQPDLVLRVAGGHGPAQCNQKFSKKTLKKGLENARVGIRNVVKST